jgi:hypothetical protein
MTGDETKPGLKSVSKEPVLRSRGFLSHPGSAAAPSNGKTPGNSPGISRGTRSHEPSTDPTRPKALDPTRKHRPYPRKPE